MTSPAASPLKRGARIPDWNIKDHEGKNHALWDYRQKSHVILLHDPESPEETIQRWVAAVEADRKQWEWLNVKVIAVSGAPKDLPPGAYAIDRYGILLNVFPVSRWSFDDLEREFLYYEAFHC